ncbi:MAG: hypothetical protein JXR94_20050 [Candidatus Hydrogenedentes bacterium]|nr:hypothetical protein [Candidatus Hydrogenedentota bacterium]
MCPSDPDAIQRVEEYWMYGPNNTFDPCRLHADSYLYLNWAILPQHFLLAGADENEESPEIGTDISGAAILALSERFSMPADESWPAPTGIGDIAEGCEKVSADLEYVTEDVKIQMCLRLREGIERFLVTDINNPAATNKGQSEIPVMWDHFTLTPSTGPAGSTYFTCNHVPGGGNVLYLDGHVKFVKYPGSSPISTTMSYIATLLFSM